MMEIIPPKILQLIGIAAVLMISVIVVTVTQIILSNWLKKKRHVNGHVNRNGDGVQGWPAQMLVQLGEIKGGIDHLGTMFSQNGFARKDDIEELRKDIHLHCGRHHEKR